MGTDSAVAALLGAFLHLLPEELLFVLEADDVWHLFYDYVHGTCKKRRLLLNYLIFEILLIN